MEQLKNSDLMEGFLKRMEQDIKGKDRQVQFEHCINIKKLKDYKVSCSYGDMVLIICILKDYLKMIGSKEGVMWDYYRNRFSKLADKLSAQIEYDYEKQVEICRKKMSAGEKENDIGEDAVMLAVKKSKREGGDRGKNGKQTGNPKEY